MRHGYKAIVVHARHRPEHLVQAARYLLKARCAVDQAAVMLDGVAKKVYDRSLESQHERLERLCDELRSDFLTLCSERYRCRVEDVPPLVGTFECDLAEKWIAEQEEKRTQKYRISI